MGGRLPAARRFARRIAEKAESTYRNGTGRPHVVRVGSYRMRVPHDMWWAFNAGEYYEQGLAYWLRRSLDSAQRPVFYDVGANYGFYTLLLSPLAEAIHAFEPVDATRRVLTRNVADNNIGNVVVHAQALSDNHGEAEIRMFSASGNNSLFDVNVADHVRSAGVQVVELDTLDRMVFERGLAAPGLVKVDVEGGELPVIRGARRVIEEVRPVFTLEFFEPHFQQAGYQGTDLVDVLSQADYSSFLIHDRPGDVGLHSISEVDQIGQDEVPNILAVPKELVPSLTSEAHTPQ